MQRCDLWRFIDRYSMVVSFLFLFFSAQVSGTCVECQVTQCYPPFSFNVSSPALCEFALAQFVNLPYLTVINSQKPTCQDKVWPWMCAAIRKMSEVSTALNCPAPVGLCPQWCSQIEGCLAENVTVCQPFVYPGPGCVNVTEADVIYPPFTYHLKIQDLLTECPGLYTVPPDESFLAPWEFGPFLELKDDPNFPPLPMVELDVPLSMLYPSHCSNVFDGVYNPDWVTFFIVYLIFYAITFPLFVWRRNFWPIRARNLGLVYVHVAYGFVIAIGFMERQIYGTSATCSITHLLAVSAGPIFMMPLFLRSYRLYFLYKWNTAKINSSQASDWYFDHRYFISNPFLHGIHIANTVIGIIVATTAVYGFQSNAIRGTILESGRCLWYKYTDQAITYAQTQGLNVNSTMPTMDPYGVGPYSVILNSCEFCTIKENIKIFATFWNYIYIMILSWIIWALRKLDDQYWLWRELVVVNLASVLLFPIMIAAIFPNAREKLNNAFGGIDFIFVAAIIIVIWSYLFSIVMPLLLTFTRRARRFGMQNPSSDYHSAIGSTSDASRGPEMSRQSTNMGMVEFDNKGSWVKMRLDIDDVINDEVGLKCLRDFEVESFKVELIEFYLRIRQYRKLRNPEEIQKEAAAIYHTFIKEGSPQQVNISGTVRKTYDAKAADGMFGSVSPATDGTPLFLGQREPKGTDVSAVELSVTLSARGDHGVLALSTGSIAASSATGSVASISPSSPPSELELDVETKEKPKRGPHLVKFSGAVREVKQLIKDDWMDFRHSRFWKIFTDDLIRRMRESAKESGSKTIPEPSEPNLRMSLKRQDSAKSQEEEDSEDSDEDEERRKKKKHESPRSDYNTA